MSEIVEFSDYLAALKRRRTLLLCVSLPIMAVSVVLACGLPTLFVSTGLLRYSGAPIPGELPQAPAAHQKAFVDLYMQGLRGAVLSPPVLRRLLREIPQVASPGETPEDALLDIVDSKRVKPVRIPILDPATSRKREVIAAFAISFDSRDPAVAQQTAAWLTQAFIGGNRAGLKMRAGSARKFYTVAAERYGERISELESQLASFKAQNFEQLPELTHVNLGELDRAQRDLDDTARQLRSLNVSKVYLDAQLTQARIAAGNQGVLHQLQAEYAGASRRYDADHPDLLSLRRQINDLHLSGPAGDALSNPGQARLLRTQLQLLRQRYGPEHPDVMRLQRQIAALAAAGASPSPAAGNEGFSGDPAVGRAVTQLDAVRIRTAELEHSALFLRDKVERLELRVDSSPLIEQRYRRLQTDLEAARGKYAELSQAGQSLDMTLAAIDSGRSDELLLLEAPQVPDRPGKPPRLILLGIGTLLAALAGLSAVVFREAFDSTVRNSRDIQRLLGLAPLVAIPQMSEPVRLHRLRWRIGMVAAATLSVSMAVLLVGRVFYK